MTINGFDKGPGHADPLPASGERHTRGRERDLDSFYWTDVSDIRLATGAEPSAEWTFFNEIASGYREEPD